MRGILHSPLVQRPRPVLRSQRAKEGRLPKSKHKADRHHEDFLKNAAHELRTPVSSISSAIEVLQAGAKNDPDARDRFLGHIEQATGQLERLLDAILVLARARSGEEEPDVSAVPLEPILQRVLDSVTPHIGVVLEKDSPHGLVVATNPRLLEQLL